MVAENECQAGVAVELGQESAGVAVGSEELDDRFEVQHLVLAVNGLALGVRSRGVSGGGRQ